MKELDLRAITRSLANNRSILLVLCVGLGLLLLPRRTAGSSGSAAKADAQGLPMAASGIPLDTESERISELLRQIRGVGAAEALLSAQGCVVICEGADSAAVRLAVTSAVAAYTGLGSDKIIVLSIAK